MPPSDEDEGLHLYHLVAGRTAVAQMASDGYARPVSAGMAGAVFRFAVPPCQGTRHTVHDGVQAAVQQQNPVFSPLRPAGHPPGGRSESGPLARCQAGSANPYDPHAPFRGPYNRFSASPRAGLIRPVNTVSPVGNTFRADRFVCRMNYK